MLTFGPFVLSLRNLDLITLCGFTLAGVLSWSCYHSGKSRR